MKPSSVNLDRLNPNQLKAVKHFEGPILVLAGAGSGKTRVLTTRVAHLISQGISPLSILAVTFTNKAAEEMRSRVRTLLNEDPHGMWLGTFHALGARFLRQHGSLLGWTSQFSIYNTQDSVRLVKAISKAIGLDSSRWSPKALVHGISDLKSQLISPQDFLEEQNDGHDMFKRKIADIYPKYQSALKEQNAFDFDDLLVKPLEMLHANQRILDNYQSRFEFILVDEFQDTNKAQFEFLRLLSQKHKNLMVVGDDDQSIYGWRGADVKNILEFEQHFCDSQVVKLEQNYRSSGSILATANAVIQENAKRKGKTLYTEKPSGERITLVATPGEIDEARWIADRIEMFLMTGKESTASNIAVLYRTNAQARTFEEVFRRKGLPYQIIGGVRFYERREIQDVLGYLRLISNPKDQVAFERIVNYPRRGIGGKSLERLKDWALSNETGLLESTIEAKNIPGMPKRGAASLVEFGTLIQKYSSIAFSTPIGELLGLLVEELDVFSALGIEGPEGEDRANNVRELIAGAHDFMANRVPGSDELINDGFSELDLFLQEVALIIDIDNHDVSSEKITLMTLHSAKGLEFPTVFISGLEEGLFPLHRAYDTIDELEEERRLFYVGITRAQDRLLLTRAGRRRRAGEIVHASASTFLKAIPKSLVNRSGNLMDGGKPELHLRSSAVRSAAAEARKNRIFGAGVTENEDYVTEEQEFVEDQEFNQDLPRLVEGERVVHDKFGSGVVRSVSGFGRDLKVAVYFDGAGEKKLLARYAGLKKDY